MILIISSCSACKDDSIPIPAKSKVIDPSYYLSDIELIHELKSIREKIFSDPKSRVRNRFTYAFDLYVRAGKAYRDLYRKYYQKIKNLLLEGSSIEWFFLSGGYGIIHSFEKAHYYQATFNYNIARQKKIPYTGKMWKKILPKILDDIFSFLSPDWTFVFGSKDYTQFIKCTTFWNRQNNVKIFESTGSVGPYRLSPIISELIESILNNNIKEFNDRYSNKFIKLV